MSLNSIGVDAHPLSHCPCMILNILPAAEHTAQKAHCPPADIGEAAFGKRLGRRPVLFFCRLINIALPTICHVGGTRFLQVGCFLPHLAAAPAV